ncbi:hypothetical protein PHYSODRAFT_296199 [Phytophthora sojae]|uniref:Uncharacterized protein n=1 Tax=Phytophthora sojae (strain P6497) TaxID=1094619 RepID=G4Z026_PHYSP|nr:hypothetical protein PHYSODRAFT_296199 [Phytophthora sojae]EGZ23966.1 hypothetical protein PHYSODRAFT_296199 [Phytophthora sojae]|eukprot:XP_009519254.1 hypothetical protein PHYSODRAFT_296199 [Phytophthora sojae]
MYELHPGVAAALDAVRGAPHDGVLVAQTQLSRLQQCGYAEAQVARWRSRGARVMSPPDPYYPERRHWPMRNWLREAKETIRYLREVNVSGDPERSWVASFRGECLCLPVVSDHQAWLIDFNILWPEDGSRDYVSVIALLQTMLSDAGFAFVNLVPSWGQSLHPEFFRPRDARFISDALFLRRLLVNEQDAWDQIARERKFSVRREDVPFQVLDPEAATAFPVEDDGDALTLTSEEQELLGMAVVTRLRLAQVRPREWSETDSSRPEPKRASSPLPARLHDHELDEGLKSEDHGAAARQTARQVDATDEETMTHHHALREAQRQIVELQAAMTARDEHERARLQDLEEVMTTRIPERDLNRSERKQQKSTQRKREIEDSRRKAAAATGIATLKEQQTRERDDLQHQFERAVAQERAAAFQEAQAISRDAERMRDEAIAGAEAAADRVKQEEERAQKERHHRAKRNKPGERWIRSALTHSKRRSG